ncbi:MAG: hypothetical protein ACK4LB_00050 [Spirosomataceae bacterium]
MPSLLPNTFLENTTHLYLPKVQVKTGGIMGLFWVLLWHFLVPLFGLLLMFRFLHQE